MAAALLVIAIVAAVVYLNLALTEHRLMQSQISESLQRIELDLQRILNESKDDQV